MKLRLSFYTVIALLTVFQSWLLSNPNLLGKVGLVIYHYRYLRTFPRTLMTVGIVMLITVFLAELVRFLVRKNRLSRRTGVIILTLFLTLCGVALIKTVLDFSTWTYSHTGVRFRYGAYLLPILLMLIFAHAMFVLPKKIFPEPLPGDEIKINPNPPSHADDQS